MTFYREWEMVSGPSGYTGSDILEHISALYRYALRLTRDSVEAEDLVHETHVRALKGIDSLREVSHLKLGSSAS